MTKPASPIGPVDPIDLSARADGDGRRRGRDERPSTAIVPVGPAATHAPDAPQHSAGDSAFAAQMMGQTGAKRGLKGGAPVLSAAKAAYLETEWSGPSDRRLAAGRMKKTDL